MRSQKRSTTRAVRFFAFLLILCLFPSSGYSQSRWWQRGDEGWFFYREAPKEEDKDEVEKLPQPLPTPASPPTTISSETPEAPLFSEVMKKRGEELLSRAMENPTIENVKTYVEHNNLMIKLSENFSTLWQKVLMTYPELESPVPTSDADKDIYFKVEGEKEREILYELSREAGLFFFYSASCPFCQRQALHLRRFLSEYPFFALKPVTMDGSVLEEFPETVPDNGISARLGIEGVPALLLAFPPARFERISSGLLTAEELKRRLILYAKKVDTAGIDATQIDIPYPGIGTDQ